MKMKMNNLEKEFVPCYIALELKNLGFEEPCFGFYVFEDKPVHIILNNDGCFNESLIIKAPLFQQAFRYLYKKMEMKGSIPIDLKSQVMFLKELIEKLKLNK